MAVRRQAYNDALSQLVRDKAWEACLLHRKTNIATTVQVDRPMADCQARRQCGSGVGWVVLQSSIDESAVAAPLWLDCSLNRFTSLTSSLRLSLLSSRN